MSLSAAFAVNMGLLRHDANKPVGVLDSSAIDASFPTTATPAAIGASDSQTGLDQNQADEPALGTTTSPRVGDAGEIDDHGTDDDHGIEEGHGGTDSSSGSTVPGHDDDD